jgi:transposase
VRQTADQDSQADIAEHVSELVADKGYHINAVVSVLHDDGIRTYMVGPARGGRRWQGANNVRDTIYANRQRIRGDRGKQLLRSRGELIERPLLLQVNGES